MATVIAPTSSYTVTDFEEPDTTLHITRGTAINNHGEITGWYELASGVAGYTADVVDNGSGTLTVDNFVTVTDPDATGGIEPYGINDSGDLVGGLSLAGSPAGFRDIGGTFTNVVVPDAVNTTLWGTDDSGDFVGDIATAAGAVDGYVATSSGSSPFTIPGDGTTEYTFAYGINDSQVIVGSYTDTNGSIHGYIDAGVTITTLDVPGADGITEAYGINNSGQVSGAYEAAPGDFVPFMYQDGTYTLYTNVQAAQFTNVGINDSGQLIGTALVGHTDQGFIINAVAACYRSGSRISTVAGMVAVEDLREGDVVRTHAGGTAAITWIGHRHIDCRRHVAPRQVWPVRIRASTFGEGRPRRDLFLSPDHAVYVDGALIPIKYLINEDSIAQVPTDEVTYYHVALPCHDVLLAEGLPAESYLDIGDRSGFADGDGPMARYPDFAVRTWDAGGCAPLVVTGPGLEAVRRRVDDLAKTVVQESCRPRRNDALEKRFSIR
jgi:hypothetical protein